MIDCEKRGTLRSFVSFEEGKVSKRLFAHATAPATGTSQPHQPECSPGETHAHRYPMQWKDLQHLRWKALPGGDSVSLACRRGRPEHRKRNSTHLVLDRRLVQRVPADRARVRANIPRPRGHSLPRLDLKLVLQMKGEMSCRRLQRSDRKRGATEAN